MFDIAHMLTEAGACDALIGWAYMLPDGTTPQQAWDRCSRPEWLLWWAGRHAGPVGSYGRRRFALACCEVTRTVLHMVPDEDDCARIAVETVEAWARGDAWAPTLEDARRAASATDNIAGVCGANATNAAICATNAVGSSPATASHVASYALCAGADPKTLDAIIRRHYPEVPHV